jgi:hypothetical protein
MQGDSASSFWHFCAAVGLLMVLVVACGGGGAFTIEDLSADTGCRGDGTMEVLGDGSVRAVGDIQYEMLTDGIPGPWCLDLVHRWLGPMDVEGYTFESEPGDPLEFTVTEAGYTHTGGSGTVTTPGGDIVTLP